MLQIIIICRRSHSSCDHLQHVVSRPIANAHEVTTDNVEEWWEETAGLIRYCGEEVCGSCTPFCEILLLFVCTPFSKIGHIDVVDSNV